MDIPVFHDDQHGTAVICAAGLINALHISKKKIEDVTAFSIFLARKYLQTIALGRRQQSDKGKGRQKLRNARRKSVNFPMIEVEAFQRNLFSI